MNGVASTALQRGGSAALEADGDRERIAVGEVAAERREPRPDVGGRAEHRDRQINQVNAGGG